MTEGHAAPVADAPAAAAGDSTGAAPVAVDTRHHADNHHAPPQPHTLKEQDSVERLTPRPTFMENLANSRDAQFHLDRRDSSELERYFVCGQPETIQIYEECNRTNMIYFIAISTVPVIWTSTRNGLCSCVCMVALPRR